MRTEFNYKGEEKIINKKKGEKCKSTMSMAISAAPLSCCSQLIFLFFLSFSARGEGEHKNSMYLFTGTGL